MPQSGKKRNIAARPPAARNGAISIERPDGQIGAIAPRTGGAGKCPAGANARSASGHGACSASGSGVSRRPAAHRSAWST